VAKRAQKNTDAAGAGSLSRRFTVRRGKEQLIQFSLLLCALVSVLTTLGIVYVLIDEAVINIPAAVVDGLDWMGGTVSADAASESALGPDHADPAFFQEVTVREFLTETRWTPSSPDEHRHFGVLPLICGTLLVAAIAAMVGLPMGILSAVYLSEYATPRVRSIIKPTLELLAGIPSIVYGFFALLFITPYVIRPLFDSLLSLRVEYYNALSAGIVVGIMILPMVCSLSEDALRAVPRSLREAGYALGSTKFDVSAKVVLPAAISGIIASFILAMSRAVGETMAVAIASGQKPHLTLNPLTGVETMTSFIANISMGETPTGTIEYKSLYAVGLCLFCVTLLMNIVSQKVMRRYREVYQ
jgi:phosphate transport system permease protein